MVTRAFSKPIRHLPVNFHLCKHTTGEFVGTGDMLRAVNLGQAFNNAWFQACVADLFSGWFYGCQGIF
jgi:hypothetical protein